jgi:hypothetical protein
MKTRTIQFTTLAVLCLFNSPQSRSAAIDFEQSIGVPPFEGMAISNQFEPFFGITFRLEKANGADKGSPVVARVGYPQAAFIRDGGVASDTPKGIYAESIGTYFLSDSPAGDSRDFKLILDFATPVSQASGYILDIDAGEQVNVAAYADSMSANALASTNYVAGGPGTGDGAATFWSFSRPTRDILRIEIDGNGANLGYDLFSSDYTPTNPLPASLGVRMYPGLSITGIVGRPYSIQYANRLGSAGWVTLTNIFLPTSPYLFLDFTATNATQRFYRTQNGQ